MIRQINQLWYPLWLYLNQPLFTSHHSSVWQPSQFWYFYKIKFLENCWNKDINSESHYTQ